MASYHRLSVRASGRGMGSLGLAAEVHLGKEPEMAALKDHRFWLGVLVGYLLVVFVPQVNFRARFGR